VSHNATDPRIGSVRNLIASIVCSAAVSLTAALLLGWLTVDSRKAAADEELTNPFLGQPEAIEDGLQIYRSKCYICHLSQGGRGPNLFATKISDEKFLETVINGRKGTQMPAFGLRLSPDDVWKVHAFVKSTDHY
jgi:mono/diheme cytochrome c family protein